MAGARIPRRATPGDLPAQQRAAAEVLQRFLATGYGPHGGAKLVDGEPPLWIRSPALALRELPHNPALAPLQDLAARVLTYGGDSATTAVLLACELVRAARSSSVGMPAFLDGYRLARRQTLAQLQALATAAPPVEALAGCSPGGLAWAQAVLAGLPPGDVDLDAIEVIAEDREGPAWLNGIPLDPQEPPRGDGPARILVLAGSWRVAPQAAAVWKNAAAARGAEAALRQRVAHQVETLGANLILATGTIDEDLRGRLADRGIASATDVALSRARRIAQACAATSVARLEHAVAADLGRAEVRKRPHRVGGWLVQTAEASRASRTLAVPASNAVQRAAAIEAGERLLRAAGLVLADPRVLPGTGAWQAAVAQSLRRAADAGPDRTPFALHAAADAFAALVTTLDRNAAGQTVVQTRDAFACVRLAVTSAFDCAIAMLRVDARHDKRASAPASLRGGLGRAGSPKGLPGDLPPLM